MKTLEEPHLCIVFYIRQSASPINHLNSPSSQVMLSADNVALAALYDFLKFLVTDVRNMNYLLQERKVTGVFSFFNRCLGSIE